MTGHTKGPWRIVIDGTCSAAWPHIGPAHLSDEELQEQSIAELSATHLERSRRGMPYTYAEKPARFKPSPDHDTIMADARLIAAAPDHAAIAWAMCAGVARWEPFTFGNGGEFCISGIRHATKLDEFGVPVMTGGMRAAIAKASGPQS